MQQNKSNFQKRQRKKWLIANSRGPYGIGWERGHPDRFQLSALNF